MLQHEERRSHRTRNMGHAAIHGKKQTDASQGFDQLSHAGLMRLSKWDDLPIGKRMPQLRNDPFGFRGDFLTRTPIGAECKANRVSEWKVLLPSGKIAALVRRASSIDPGAQSTRAWPVAGRPQDDAF